MAKTLSEYQKAIEASLEDISKLTFKAELLGAQEARVQLEIRTFSSGGKGVKDVNGKSLSQYSKAYAARRKAAGLQTKNKDLIFTGELSRNVTLGNSNGKPAYGFLTEEAADIAKYQEQQNDTKIFELNKSELDNVRAEIKDTIMASIKEMVKKWAE